VQPVPNRHKVLLLLSRYFSPSVHSKSRLTRPAVTKLIQTFVTTSKHLHFPSKHLELVGIASCCHHFAVLVKQQNAIVETPQELGRKFEAMRNFITLKRIVFGGFDALAYHECKIGRSQNKCGPVAAYCLESNPCLLKKSNGVLNRCTM
jgi:hypothetical protein